MNIIRLNEADINPMVDRIPAIRPIMDVTMQNIGKIGFSLDKCCFKYLPPSAKATIENIAKTHFPNIM